MQKTVTDIYKLVTTLGCISAGFAARLTYAGALNALFGLDGQLLGLRGEAAGREAGAGGTSTTDTEAGQAYKGRTQLGWAAVLGEGAGAGATAAQYQSAALACVKAFAGSVPQVNTRG